MKRWIALLLAVVMVFSAVGCNNKKQKPSADKAGKDTEPLTAVGVYEPGTNEFNVLRDKFYDYFIGLLGYSFISETGKDDTFNQDELIKFALVQMSYAGNDMTAGVKKSQLDRITRRHFSQRIESLDNTTLVTQDEGIKELYHPNNMEYAIGQFMILQHLEVEENGICTAVFHRFKPEGDVFGEISEDVVKSNLIDGNYEGFGEPETVEMTFRERDTAAFGYYVQAITLRVLENPAI